MVRFERRGDRIMLRKYSAVAVADDTLAIAASVQANYFPPILASWEIEARGADSASSVIDITDFFAGDTRHLSGLSSAQRSSYQVRRLDPDRSYISRMRSYPLNVNVRHTLTYDAGAPPSDPQANTVTMEMNQSLVLLPAEPMRPRYADPRVGYFTVERINYGLNEQKAATETFIRRWRLEPSDPEAYARGEVVDPVKPITYYVDPATPERYVDASSAGSRTGSPPSRPRGSATRSSRWRPRRRRRTPTGTPRTCATRWRAGRRARRATRWARAPRTRAPERSSSRTSSGTTTTCVPTGTG